MWQPWILRRSVLGIALCVTSVLCGAAYALPGAERPGVPQRSAVRLQDLAGEYHLGDGLGDNRHLTVTASGTFTYHSHGCVGDGFRNHGVCQVANGLLILQPEEPDPQDLFANTPTRIIPVSWQTRLYLIPESQLIAFCNAVNAGEEPRTRTHGNFYLRRGDEKKPVNGMPDLPAKGRAYLLPWPVVGTVIAIEPSGQGVINRGSTAGLKPGMQLSYDYSKTVTVVSTSATQAIIKNAYGSSKGLLQIGGRVNSRVGYVTTEGRIAPFPNGQAAPPHGARSVLKIAPGPIAYWWHSPQEILLQIRSSPFPHSFSSVLRNVTTGKDRALASLTKDLQRDPPYYAETATLSPNGTRMLWEGSKAYYAEALDGSARFSWKSPARGCDCYPLWGPDSRHLLGFTMKPNSSALWYVEVLPIAPTATSRRLTPPQDVLRLLQQIKESPSQALPGLRVLADSWNGEAGQPSAPIQIYDLPLTGNANRIRKHAVTLPKDAYLFKITFSPNGTRIAWELGLHDAQESTIGIWISNLDGSRMHRVAWVNVDAHDPPDKILEPSSIRWLPNSKAISFVTNYKLWIAPAD